MLNILNKLTYIAVALPLLFLIGDNYLLLLIIATIMSSFVCVISSIVAQAKLWNGFRFEDPDFHISQRELLKYGFPYIISMGISTIFQAIDKISLNRYCSYTEVGIYASTTTLINVFNIIQSTFNALWAPMAMEHYSKEKDDHSFYQKGNQLITVIMYFVGISLILCKDVFAFFLGEKYREAAYILPFLIFNPIMYTISETTVSGLVFAKKSTLQIVVAIGACVTNVIGNTILVPIYGAKGAAISTGLSYIVFFTLRTMLSNRYFYVNFRLKQFYTLTALVALYALYNTFISFNIGTIIGYLICLIVLIVLYVQDVRWGIQYLINMANNWILKRNN